MIRATSLKTTTRWAGLLLGVALIASFLHFPLHGQPASISPSRMARITWVDERFVSYNIEMIEVTGGRFWAPYRSGAVAPPQQPAAPSVPGLDPNAFRMRPPIDLANVRLRGLAGALGPAYMRVSGTWANSTYFHDEETPAPEKAPEGFGGVLTRAQWRGVVDFAKAADAEIVTSFAISPGVRDASGVWTPVEAQKLLAYTASIGGRIVAAELFNEPNLTASGGAPKGYDAAAFGRDFGVFLPFIRKAAPGLLVLGPGSVGEGGLLANYPGMKSEAMLRASGGGVDAFSYHSYNGVSQRCAGRGSGGSTAGQTTPDAALTGDWLSRTERDARFYGALRDRFAPGKPLWLTESGETACGGNPWASTFTDTFRYVEQLGRLARLGVRVVMHNTLAASDYALIDEETLEPRPSYWAALLWRRLMGTAVLDAGPSPASGVDVFAHCLVGTPSGVALVAVNTDRSSTRAVTIPASAERYTLASSTGLLSHRVTLNGRELRLEKDDSVPALRGIPTQAGEIDLPPASITFLAVSAAGNPDCKSSR
jgi:heparanase 1